MSQGGVFKITANDGKADRIIMATLLLNQRIVDITCRRAAQGKADTTPTLVDLEQTHIIYMNAHFKPFAAIGFEYNKVRPAGSATLGAGVTFNIPQFGDFFYDMVCRVRLTSFMGVAGKSPVQAVGTVFPLNDTLATTINTSFNTYNLVDATGKIVVAGVASGATAQVDYRNFVRYCEYPGNRLFHLTKFDVNGNPLDSYDEMIPVMLEKFCTAPNKRTGHDRLVGQEVPLTGYTGLQVANVTDADYASTPAGVISKDIAKQSNQTVGLFTTNAADIGAAVAGTTVLNAAVVAKLNATGGQTAQTTNQFDVSRGLRQIVNGPQTPKPMQPALEIWNKLRFWFNDDVRLAIASVSIPFGQRWISMELCQKEQLAYEFPSLYIEKINNFNVSTAITTRTKTYTPLMQTFGTTDISVDQIELYINNIFVNPEIHDIFIKRIGFSLIRVYRQHTQRCTQENGEDKLLSQLKWPIEYMFVGLRPVFNIKTAVTASGVVSSGNTNTWRDWHRLTRVIDATVSGATLAESATAGATVSTSIINKVIPDSYYLPVPTIDSLSLTAHGIVIFDGFQDTFYNQYMPFQYGGANLTTPEDPGAMFVNMALFPRSYQPSGHLNISRARETYLKWTSSYVSAKTPVDMIVVGVAINFLLISEGSAVLRYST